MVIHSIYVFDELVSSPGCLASLGFLNASEIDPSQLEKTFKYSNYNKHFNFKIWYFGVGFYMCSYSIYIDGKKISDGTKLKPVFCAPQQL